MQKLGLWPGGFLKFSADTGFGSNAFHDAGTIVPVNTAALLPAPDDRTRALMNATLTQFFSPQFGVFARPSPPNLAHLLLNEQFPILANPGPVLAQILASGSRTCWSRPNQPIVRAAAGRSAIASINISGSPMVTRSMGLVPSSRLRLPTGTLNRSNMPFSPALAARGWCRAVQMTALASGSRGPSSAAVSFLFCVSSLTSACNVRTRSRCTTIWRSRRG